MKPKLIIIQNKPTQFDAPLYAYLHGKHDFKLQIYYTDTSDKKNSEFDPEIGRSPQWDHLNSCEYIRRDLTNFKTNNLIAVSNDIALQKPNLVILLGYFPFLHLKLAFFLKTKGIRIGLRSDNTIPHSNFKGIKGVIKRLFLPFCLKQYDTWHPVGTLARKYFEKISNTKKPTFFFPYNVDNDWFESESNKHRICINAIRAEMGFSSKDFVVLGIMKWHDREDPFTLIDAFAKLKDRHKNARLLLVGDGPLRDAINAKVSILGNTFFLPGYVPYSELPKYYAISNIFVHPAINEPWGVSVNEAMACGVPVIAAEGVGSGTDLIIEWKTGATFFNRDINSLAEKLSLMVKNPGLIFKMGKAAKQKISHWNYDRTCQELMMAIEG